MDSMFTRSISWKEKQTCNVLNWKEKQTYNMLHMPSLRFPASRQHAPTPSQPTLLPVKCLPPAQRRISLGTGISNQLDMSPLNFSANYWSLLCLRPG